MNIKTVTVLGANGSMGKNVAAMFASFGDAQVYMVCRSLQDARNAKKAAEKSVRAETIAKNLIPKTYDDLQECLSSSDLVFESVAENLEIKRKIYKLISQHIKSGTIIGTGTSGLSINILSESFSNDQKKDFLGIHFYNPPYSMTLCEVIPSAHTDRKTLFDIKQYLKSVLYRDVVEIKDSPAFMGNRIGFQFINEALQIAEQYKDKGGIDYIDAIFGGFTGRNMPPLVTSDFVGLDVHKAIIDNIYENLQDYEHETFIMPDFAIQLISENKLGRKTGEGLYRKVVDKDGRPTKEVFDIATKCYRPIRKYNFDFVQAINKNLSDGQYSVAIKCLVDDQSDEARLCMRLLLKYVLYSLHVTSIIGEDIHSADHVMATGFNWIPPLAMIDALKSVDSFEAIVRNKFPKEYLDEINLDEILTLIEKSSYDFRPFLKAK